MKDKKLEDSIAIPEGVKVTITGSTVVVTGKKGEIKKDFVDPKITVHENEGELIIKAENATKREKTRIGTFRAHLRNMFKGVSEGHVYKLKICSGHFPMNVSVKGTQFVMSNYLGEKVPRVLNIKEGAKVTINGTEVLVEGIRKDVASQVAADIEQLCRITNRDRRVFQDGIYIVEKDGKPIL